MRHKHSGLDPEWAKLAAKQLKSEEALKKLVWRTSDGIDVKPIYTAKDVEK